MIIKLKKYDNTIAFHIFFIVDVGTNFFIRRIISILFEACVTIFCINGHSTERFSSIMAPRVFDFITCLIAESLSTIVGFVISLDIRCHEPTIMYSDLFLLKESLFNIGHWCTFSNLPVRKTSCLIDCLGDKATGQHQNSF